MEKNYISVGRKRKTHQEFLQEVQGLVGEEYTVIGKYEVARQKIKMRHNVCGHEYMVFPNKFTSQGHRCPACSSGGSRTLKTQEQYIQQIKNIQGDQYSVVGEYMGSKEKIRVKHNKCGYEWEVKAQNFLKKSICPKCGGYMRKGHEGFVQEVEQLNGAEYTVLGEYINNKTKIKIKHNKCGATYEVIPKVFLRGKKCPSCGEKSKRGTYI